MKMNWTDLPCNELLKRVFVNPPKIGSIDIFDIEIKRDGPTVIVSFDLIDVLPDNPPVKWGRDFNRCRMGIYCIGVSELSMTGLATNILAKIDFRIIGDATTIIISSDSLNMELTCSNVTVTGPSVYKSN
ncbi:uncharacterized protein EpC_11060 [Erwinia pyrifoliae Ep1/96]|nr:hypothetical protein CPI84_13275 [Erwinia pyrifoliae]CAX54885.1 uncharacterized protein EpC_11060 [Erwinia pyrifoliae Ep1/96]